MAQQIIETQPIGPTTEEGFIADRQTFWTSFTHFMMLAIGGVAGLLILMAIFLL